MTENFENWDKISLESAKELKAMRKNLRRRNWTIILTSVILVATLLLAAVKIIIPSLERRYWNPTQCSYLDEVTDLELTMSVYSELFGHGQHLVAVDAEKDGFASYSVDAIFANWNSLRKLTDVSFSAAAVDKGEFRCPMNFWNNAVQGSFIKQEPAEREYISNHNKRALKYLRQLPEYVDVFATVTFSQDLTMHELLLMSAQYTEGAEFTWAAVRDAEVYNTTCGMHLVSSYDHQYSPNSWADAGYPDLFVERYDWNATQMENHIKSMLKFSADQVEKDQGILPPGEDAGYYTKTLSYIEQNGVKVYGSYVIATPQTLIEMIKSGEVSYVTITDARIGLPL